MDALLQHLVNGLVLGGTYALLGIGLTLIFGLMNLVNFANGEFYTLGAYATFAALALGGLNFFAAIAASAQGKTLIHDWVYDNRAIYLTDLNRLGGRLQLLDPHRVLVEGPTRWRAAEMMCPPALRPAVVVLLAMMAAEGTSVLRNVYVINRGYEDLATRLNSIGAQIEIFRDI